VSRKQPPKPPPEKLYEIERRDPTRAELRVLLDAAVATGVRPGLLGAIVNLESAGTWHPLIRPPKKGTPAAKISETGRVVVDPAGTAVGIAQYTEPTFAMSIYKSGEQIIRNARLDQVAPEQAAIIRAAMLKMKTAPALAGKLDWNKFDSYVDANRHTPEIQKLMTLRSDPTGRVPLHTLAIDAKGYQNEVSEHGFEANATNTYALHFHSIGFLKDLNRKADHKLGEDSKYGLAALANGGVFGDAVKGTSRTGAQIYADLSNKISDAHASNFEKKFYGRDFGLDQDRGKPRTFRDRSGQPVPVRADLIVPQLRLDQFPPLWAQLNPKVETPDRLASTLHMLERLGYDHGRKPPTDFNNPRLKVMISTYKQQAGLPYPEAGLDTATEAHLKQAVARLDYYAALQAKQRRLAADSPNLVDIQKIQNDRKSPLPPDKRQAVDQYVIEIKGHLASQGFLPLPPKGRNFDGRVDRAMLSALSEFQLSKGLLNTKGVYDKVTGAMLMGIDPARVVGLLDDEVRTSQAAPSQDFNTLADRGVVQTAALAQSLQVDELPAAPQSGQGPTTRRDAPRHG